MSTKVVFTCPYKNTVERVKQSDLVNVTVTELDPNPPKSNPFHHDSCSFGTNLPRSWMVMSSGFDKEHGFESFYLTNTETGQRINLDFEAKTPTYSVDVYIGEKHDIDPGGVYCWRRDGGSVKWVNINDWAAWVASMGAARYATRSPAYVVIDRWFVRLDIVVNDVLFAKWIAETEPQGDGVELIQLSMGQLFDLHNKLREEACASN